MRAGGGWDGDGVGCGGGRFLRQAVAVWIDHHCHLPADSTAADIVSEATEAGVVALVNVGCDIEGSRRAAESAARFDTVWATAGVHPHDAKDGIDGLEALLDLPG